MKTWEIRNCLTEGEYKTTSNSHPPWILLTFSPWHLNWLYNTKKNRRRQVSVLFFAYTHTP